MMAKMKLDYNMDRLRNVRFALSCVQLRFLRVMNVLYFVRVEKIPSDISPLRF